MINTNSIRSLTRREFLGASALATGVLAAAPFAPAADKPKSWPVTARDAHLKVTGQPDSWSAMDALGVDGVEVVVNEALACPSLFQPGRKFSLATADDLKLVKDQFQQHGKIIGALCMNNRLDERLEEELAWTKKLVAAAVALRVNAIRIDVWPHKLADDQFLPFAVKACRQFCDLAEGTPVRFGIENHGRITNNPDFLDKLFDGVGSPKLGLTMDFMNFYWFGHPLDEVYRLCEKFASRAFHTHCKNLRYPEDKRNTRRPIGWEYEKYVAPLPDGDLDYSRLAALLRKAGYQADLCLENECLSHFPKDQHLDVLRKEIALLRQVA